ncbi:MAG TPA: hypothetical protein VIV40_31510, partial [Kofleriaceae bacterium]
MHAICARLYRFDVRFAIRACAFDAGGAARRAKSPHERLAARRELERDRNDSLLVAAQLARRSMRRR